MHPNNIPFQLTNWESIPTTGHKGESGMAIWKTLQLGDLRVRMVEYSPNYKADHRCEKGHIVFCVEGEMITEMADGSKYFLKKNMSYIVSDELSSHRTFTENGAKLFIVDGGFLKLQS
jgi:hypothetical protein